MKLNRLWIVSELYYPEQTSTGYFLTRIAEGLSRSMSVEVVCGQPTYSEHGMRAPRRERRHGVLIHRMRATHFDKDRLLLRILNIATLTLSVAWFALVHFRRGDRLLVVTNPPMLPPVLGLIVRAKRMRSMLLVHDVYPEILAATGMVNPSGFAYRLLKRFFDAMFRSFDTVIVLGRDMADLVRSKLGNAASAIQIIPNWGDIEEVVPIAAADNPFLQRYAITATCRIQFSGNIGRTHDVETILRAAHAVRDNPDIEFSFVGYGGKTGIVADAMAAGLDNVRLFARQPREMLGPMLSSATATVISFIPSMKGLSVPSRMYNVLSAGTPIIAIADADSELALVISEEQAGWVIAPGDQAAFTALIEWLSTPEGQQEAKRRGARGRAAVARSYTFDSVIVSFEALTA